MPESTTATTGLTSQYADQVAGDLERNTKEQERINAEIAALQEQLATLQQDHSVLVNVQQALGHSPTPGKTTTGSESTAVPAPRTKAASERGAGKRTRSKKTTTSAGRTSPVRPAAKKSATKQPAAPKSTGKAARPTLVALVRDHLTEASEPRSAAEVTTALETVHPERDIKATVVRTTLEGLVAKNQAHRSKQGSSVFYTAADKTQEAPSKQAG